jgi:Ca2+/Na+ antiporter
VCIKLVVLITNYDVLLFLNIFPANKVVTLRSVGLLYCVCYVVLLKLFRQQRAANTFLEGRMLASPDLDSPQLLSLCAVIRAA